MKNGVMIFSFWVLFMASALAVVYMTHKTRLATHELEQLKDEQASLQVQSGQLLLEKSSLAAFVRVEQLATEKLEMKVPNTDEIVLVKP